MKKLSESNQAFYRFYLKNDNQFKADRGIDEYGPYLEATAREYTNSKKEGVLTLSMEHSYHKKELNLDLFKAVRKFVQTTTVTEKEVEIS